MCSSVEPPPSYTSQQDQNVLDTTIIEGAINLSFCPDEDVCFPDQSATHNSNHTMDSSFYSVHSMKSWADNLDADTLSLGSQICEHENGMIADIGQSSNSAAPRNQPHLYKSVTQPQRFNSSASVNRFQKSVMPEYPKKGYGCAAKISSRVQRAKALGRQYSSTPMLSEHSYPSVYNRRVSLETSDIESSGYKVAPIDNYSLLINDNYVTRRIKSAVQLNQKLNSEPNSILQKEPNKAESTTCCNSRQNIVKNANGSQGLKFWRNNTESMSKACVSRCKSEASIPEVHESDEGFQEDSDLGSPAEKTPTTSDSNIHNVKSLVFRTLKVPSQRTSNSLSQLYLSDMNSTGSDSSINSWMC